MSINTSPNPDIPLTEDFPELNAIPWLRHTFILRIPGLSMVEDRVKSLQLLQRDHNRILLENGISRKQMVTAEQVHGSQVAWLEEKPQLPVAGADGLATRVPGLPIGIYVADCCAIYLIDTEKKAIALLHSGLRGTQKNIAGEGVEQLIRNNSSNPSSILALLSPCIRGCCYRQDFADRIVEQLRAKKVENIIRHDRCTSCHIDAYYSYHKEKGCTGRMLAALMMAP